MVECLVFGFQRWKQGNSKRELDDYYHFSPRKGPPRVQLEGPSVRVAVADGATESSFSAEWAKMLVRAYCGAPFRSVRRLRETAGDLSRHWREVIVNRRQLAWYAAEKARMGAFATFLGLELSDRRARSGSGSTWNAIAVGDTCAFRIRDNQLSDAFPMRESLQFGTSPFLISSNLRRNDDTWNHVVKRTGIWQPGDVFVLATDALAAWFLREHELGKEPWTTLLDLAGERDPEGAFASWIENLRASSAIKNDDVTCLLVWMQGYKP